MPEAGPELSVVCKNCGAEVSPYVTECPYCGTRLRKRAPQLERRGDELAAKETRRDRRERRRRAAATERAERAFAAVGRPYVTIAAIVIPAVILILIQARVFDFVELGLIGTGQFAGPADASAEPWRYFAAPWLYDDAGYLFVCGLGLAIFARGVERRLGSVATALLLISCGALGMLAADGIAEAFDSSIIIAGGNGVALGAVCAWAALRRSEARVSADDEPDWLGVAAAAAVLLLLPLVEDTAGIFAGVAGGLVGGLAGFTGARFARAA